MASNVVNIDENLDSGEAVAVGSVWFCYSRGGRVGLSSTPCQTNVSREFRLCGWCGTTNNIEMNAHGVVRVVKRIKDNAAAVQELHGEGMAEALRELGFAELTPATA